jgi:hypothetical protein
VGYGVNRKWTLLEETIHYIGVRSTFKRCTMLILILAEPNELIWKIVTSY